MMASKSKRTSSSTVLFVASNPTEIKFDFAKELHFIEEAGRAYPESFGVIARWSVSVEQFKQYLATMQPDVIHLLSPGVDPTDNTLVLSDERGRPQYVNVGAFAGAFARRRGSAPKLVVLNTCHSRPHAEALLPHVGCVVAMDGTIDDNAAIGFAAAFYQALAAGFPVTDAFMRGRDAVKRITPEQEGVPLLLPGHANPSLVKIAAVTEPFPEARKVTAPTMTATRPSCVQIFCSYSHKDSKYRAELEVFLASLRSQGMVSVWHDRLIKPGTDWAEQIDQNLDHANVILLLVSADFLASQYCMGIECSRALDRHKSEGVRLIPILIRECDLAGVPFAGLQWLPTGSKPVKKWSDRDSAWTDVAKGIREAVEDLVASSSGRTR